MSKGRAPWGAAVSMATDNLAQDPAGLTDEQLIEICLETPSSSTVGLRFHLEQKKREKRSQKLLIWLSFWAACAATGALMLTIALIISKAVS